jgi:replicative DNA helicase
MNQTAHPNALIPPHSAKAERSVLGAIMVSRPTANQIMELLDTSDFYFPTHQTVFQAARQLFNNHQPIDVLTIAEELRRTNSLETIGGHQYLADLTTAIADISHTERYAATVRENFQRRQLMETSLQILDLATNLDQTTPSVIDQSQQKILDINTGTREPQHLSEVIEAVFQFLHPTDHPPSGITTGLSDIDRHLLCSNQAHS